MNVEQFNLAANFDLHGRTWAEKPAIMSAAETLTHAELADAIRRTADHLAGLGAGIGTRVGLSLADTACHLVCLLALGRLGAVAVPMDVRWTASEKARLAAALDIAFMLVEPGSENDALGCPRHPVDADWRDAVARQPGTTPVAMAAELPFVFSLSSGTTATPSGPLLCHHHFFHRFVNQWVTLGFNSHDRFLATTPLYFGATRGFCLSTLYAGGTVCLMPQPLKAAELCIGAAKYDATTAFFVPTQMRWLLTLDDDVLAPLHRLRALVSSGAALHADEQIAVRSRLCRNLFNYYGTTEGGGISILAPGDEDAGAGSVGRPVFMVEVEIVDEADRALSPGDVGRIRYRGPAMAAGNTMAAGDHASATHPDGWFYPGDLGMLDPNGFLHLRGRSKDLIVRGGINIYPLEIEQSLLTLDGVADAAVVGWPSGEFGEEIAAFVIPSKDDVSAAELRAACRTRLAPYKIPRQVFFVEELPRNSLGKVLKGRLKEKLNPLP